ncbi:VOC family protein [Exiguobacterium sp. BRG2]|uniref:VOC family protein n=1 Tax=Exiguobacterium sp. BRG2 TaxID=2962584 RepID=UPI0037BFF95E
MIQYGYTILYVEDTAQTLTFYRDVLGLSVKAEHGSYIEFSRPVRRHSPSIRVKTCNS